jgi:hypothetical protein
MAQRGGVHTIPNGMLGVKVGVAVGGLFLVSDVDLVTESAVKVLEERVLEELLSLLIIKMIAIPMTINRIASIPIISLVFIQLSFISPRD